MERSGPHEPGDPITDSTFIEQPDESQPLASDEAPLNGVEIDAFSSRRILKEGFRANIELNLAGVALHPALVETVRNSLTGRWPLVVPHDGRLTVNYSIESADAAGYRAADDYAASLVKLVGAENDPVVEIWGRRSRPAD